MAVTHYGVNGMIAPKNVQKQQLEVESVITPHHAMAVKIVLVILEQTHSKKDAVSIYRK